VFALQIKGKRKPHRIAFSSKNVSIAAHRPLKEDKNEKKSNKNLSGGSYREIKIDSSNLSSI
jgi:hypothetical protein